MALDDTGSVPATGTDNTQAAPASAPAPADAPASPAAGQDAGGPAPAPAPAEVDPDEAAYLAAVAAEKAELEQQPPAAAPQAPAQPAAGPQPDAPQPVVLPRERFVAITRTLQRLNAENERLKGEREAYQRMATSQPPASAAPDASPQGGAPTSDGTEPVNEQALLADLRAAKRAAIKQFEAGELTADQYADEIDRIDAQRDEITARVIAEELGRQIPAAADSPVSIADRQIEVVHSQKLKEQYPYLNEGGLSGQNLAQLKAMAEAQAVALGRPYGRGSAENIRLREAIGELSTIWGPKWNPGYKPPARAASNAPTGAGSAPTGGTPARNAPTGVAQQRLAKLELAASLPPDASRIGTNGTGAPTITADQIARMSDLELESLPENVRAQFR